MRLTKFSYKNVDWEIKDLNLQTVNLIVGENATGKTRTLTQIGSFVKLLRQQDNNIDKDEWEVQFITKNKETLKYVLKTLKTKVVEEYLWLNDKLIIERKKGEIHAKIRGNTQQNWIQYLPPTKKLAIYSFRDTEKFPHSEAVLEWAEHSYGFEFSYPAKYDFLKDDLLNSIEDTTESFTELTKKQQSTVVDSLNAIGFNINEIVVKKYEQNDAKYLLIDEKNVNKYMFLSDLSQGMSRCITLIVYVEFLIRKKTPATIVIDDFGEGLDYRRATELGKIVFKRCLENNIQLVATSNDNFLMNVVDIDYWNVLIREGKVVKAINKVNHPTIFEDFRFEGTSNFNFFSSSFLPSRL